MSLITCPECGRENVSSYAESCPQCGYPIKNSIIANNNIQQLRCRNCNAVYLSDNAFCPFCAAQSSAIPDNSDVSINCNEEQLNLPICPVCKRNDEVWRIPSSERVLSVITVGLASSLIGKQYECGRCKHKW